MNNQVPETARLEIKFVAYEHDYYNLLHWIRMHKVGFVTPFPDRRVNNIYFDNHSYRAYTDNVIGSSFRTKLRYRWYGNSDSPAPGVLEVKCKRNNFGWKLQYNVPKTPYSEGDNWSDIRRSIIEQLPDDAKTWMNDNPFPILINRYKRNYFLTSDREIRATIDTGLTVLEQRFKSYPNFVQKANHPRIMVVEFKFARENRDYATELIQGIPLRVSRYSKYITGLSVLSR